MFVDSGMKLYILGFMNSCVAQFYLNLINPTINFLINDILALPVVVGHKDEIEKLVLECIRISKEDYDSSEIAHDFRCHPMVALTYGMQFQNSVTIEEVFVQYKNIAESRIAKLRTNEERLNALFIENYNMGRDLSPALEDKEIVLHRSDIAEEIMSLISYAVGCMVGRYSLDKPGLAFAGGAWDASQYVAYPADKDGILPITDDEYFADDIVTMFVNWLKTVYGADTLEENLRFISDALGGKGSPREVIRNYFLNDFYKDHLKVYQKRPIYWLFDSGKKNGFKALVYMHRYQPDTIARVRTDYVHEMQSRYRTAIADVEQRLNDASTSERVKLTKRLNALQAQADELRQYEEKIHHLADQMIAIDLDDGVKVNYAKFADVLATIK